MSPLHMRHSSISIPLVFSYVLDWIALVVIAAIGAGFSQVGPRKRPFDITDRSISYPLRPETISNSTLVLTTLLVPAVVIFVGSLLVHPAPSGHASTKASVRRKLWEWNVGWMGLALSYALAFIVANGAKEVLGKPRPNLLARCDPDVARSLNSTAGGIGDQVEEGINMYDWRICRNSGPILEEGFRSFPSGHSSLAFAGLGYLSLWLCAKLGVSLPLLLPRNPSPSFGEERIGPTASEQKVSAHIRAQAAAPPIYLIFLPLVSVGGAIYISCTRYSDYWHHGFDVFVSAILGIVTAWVGFRWYHVPIQQMGSGWAWAPRSPKRAFWRSVGTLTYTNTGEMEAKEDPEAGGAVRRQFLASATGASGGRVETSHGSSGSYEMNDFAGAAVQAPTDFTAYNRAEGSHGPIRQ